MVWSVRGRNFHHIAKEALSRRGPCLNVGLPCFHREHRYLKLEDASARDKTTSTTQLAPQDFAATMSLFTYFLCALYCAPFYVSSAQAYRLDKKFDSSNFLDSFDFIERHNNYTGGCANYVSKQDATSIGLARTIGAQVYLGADNSSSYDVTQPDAGRKSVRLESHDTIDSGIIIADFEHLPANACGMWPSL
jgi:hypothetical protein